MKKTSLPHTRATYESAAFQAIVEQSFDVIAIIGSDGGILYLTPSVERVLGYTAEERLGHSPKDLVHPDDWPTVEAERRRAVAGKEAEGYATVRVRHKNGEYRTVEFVAQNLLDNPAVQGIVYHYRDVTDRVTVQRKLTGYQQRYEKAFRSSPDSITMCRLDDGVFIEANEGFERMMGYTRDEVIGRSANEIGMWASRKARRRMIDTLRSRGSVRDFQADFRCKDEAIITCLLSAEIIQIDGNNCMLCVIRDITQELLNYERLREASELLRRDHAELTKKNIALEQVLEHIEREKSQFRHEISANIDNLFRPIVNKLAQEEGRLSSRELDTLRSRLDSLLGADIDEHRNNMAKLTPRELDICELIRSGQTSKEIADALRLSPQTIHKHRQSIRRKLQLDNRGINLSSYLRSR